MKKFCLLMLIVLLTVFICSCSNDTFGIELEKTPIPGESDTDSTNSLKNSDFVEEAYLVKTEQYGKTRIQIFGEEESVNLFVRGKNLCGGVSGTKLPKTYNGVTYTLLNDGTITASGQASNSSSLCYIAGKLGDNTSNADRIFLTAGTYTFSGTPKGGSDSTYRMRLIVLDEEENRTYYNDIGDGITFSLLKPSYVVACIQILDGTTVDELSFKPQIEVGEIATEYEQYRGELYNVNIENGQGVIEFDLPMEKKIYTIMSTAPAFKIEGFGSIKDVVKPIVRSDKPHFAIIDDDGKDDVYSVLMPLLNQRGIKFSTSVIPTKLNTTGYLTTDQVRQIYNAGNKIMCHSKSHKNLKNEATTYEERYEEIIGGKQMLADMGFVVDTMVYPNGSYDDEVIELTKSFYKYGISTSGETKWGAQRYNEDPIDLYKIERVNIGSYYAGQTADEKAQALEDAKKNVDECIKNNYLCVIMTHIGDAGEDGIAQIVELINYIESKGYKIDDFDTAIKAHIQPAE